MSAEKILIWVPTPLGDAVMATPALRAFRQLYRGSSITCLANPFTRQILSGSGFCDNWVTPEKSFFKLVKKLRTESFDAAILLKNSFSCALAVSLAGIDRRIGYARDGRSLLLNERISPERQHGRFKPGAMIDYYLKIAEHLDADINSRKPSLAVEEPDNIVLLKTLPFLQSLSRPLVILVPGGAFGPSKIWPIQRYASLADALSSKYGAQVLISIAPIPEEIQIAESICSIASSKPIHLGGTPLAGGPLKALFAKADLVITNDTGPRHIAIALDKNVISLFGPNNPQWTQTGHSKEVQIIGKAQCVPCDKPRCRAKEHFCMQSITVESVLAASEGFLSTAK